MATRRLITSVQVLEELSKKEEQSTYPILYDDASLMKIVREVDGMENFVTPDNGILSVIWFEKVWPFQHGLAKVKLAKKRFNFLTHEGKFLFQSHIVFWEEAKEGLVRAQREDEKWNFIRPDGSLLSPDTWFRYVTPFKNRLAMVMLEDEKYNYIRTDGSLLSPNLWFRFAGDFEEGYAVVQLADLKYNCIKTDGGFLLKSGLTSAIHGITVNPLYHGFVWLVDYERDCWYIVKPDGNLVWKKSRKGTIYNIDKHGFTVGIWEPFTIRETYSYEELLAWKTPK